MRFVIGDCRATVISLGVLDGETWIGNVGTEMSFGCVSSAIVCLALRALGGQTAVGVTSD